MKSSLDFSLPQWPGSLWPTFFESFTLKKITWLALQSAAQFVQDVCTVHSRAIVVEPQQCGIANTRFLSQAVQGPSLVFENFSEPTNNHGGNLAGPERICQSTYTCIVSFTQQDYGSKLVATLKGNSEAAVKPSEVKRHAS
jgi:hypothetical protein